MPDEMRPETCRVLIIDDSATIRHSAAKVLRAAGLQVELADNGFEALAHITDHRPDLILLDVMMPRLDGYQTCSLLRRHPAYASVPVVMLSGKDSVFDRVRGRVAGSDQYLTKPFTSESLLAAVYQQLPQLRPGGSAVASAAAPGATSESPNP